MKSVDLFLDTSFTHLRVGLFKAGTYCDGIDMEAYMRQSEEMIPSLSLLMERHGIGKDDIASVTVARGPGSYTGVRIAMTAAKTMALALKIPLFLVSSLMILAEDRKTAVCMDARARRSYFAVYEDGKPIVEDSIWANDDVLSYLNDHPDCLLGGEPAYLGLQKTAAPDVLFNMLRWRGGPSDVLKAAPVYLRGPTR